MAADGAGDDDDLAAALAMSQDPSAMAEAALPAVAPRAPLSPADAAVAALQGNSPAILSEAGTLQVLSALLGNLVKNPAEEKFRRVKLTNAKISKGLSCPGAEALLLAAGFVRTDELLEVPGSVAPEQLQLGAQAALDALKVATGGFELSAQLHADGEVRCVAALPAGGVAFGAMDNVVRVYSTSAWSTMTPQLLSGHERRAGVDGVLAVVALGEGGVVSAGRDGKIISWVNGAEAAQMKGHGEGVATGGSNLHVVSCLGLRADGRLVSGGWDKTVRVWNGADQESILEGNEYPINAVAGLDNGDVAMASGLEAIVVWRGTERRQSLPVKTVVRALCSCGGNLLASADNDGVVRVWDAEAGRQVAERKVCPSYLLSLARSAETGELAAGGVDGLVTLLALEGTSLRVVETLQHCGDVYGLAFLANGDLAAACGDSTCVVWSRSSSRTAAPAAQQDFTARAKALAVAQAAADTASGASASLSTGAGAGYEFSFPVELGAQKLQLSWNRGEEASVVADRFILESALDPKHRGDVVTFVMQTMQQNQGAATGPAAGGAKDFNYPVEVADGRKLNISWNRGDDAQSVAMNFARENGGIHPSEIPDIVNFIQQVSGQPTSAAPAVTVQQAAAVSPAMMQQAIQQVVDMGFDPAGAKAVLEASNWDVEAALNQLLS